MKSDIFYENAISLHLERINKVKNFLILSAKEPGIDESEAIYYLSFLVDLEHDLNKWQSDLPILITDKEKPKEAKQ